MNRVAICLVLCFSCTSLFADTIFLKSGRQIECERAWEEGKEVKYVISEGVVGLPRSMVAKIVKSEPAVQTAPANPQTAPAQTRSTAGTDPLSLSERQKLARSYTNMGAALLEKKDYVSALENFKKAYEMVKDRETVFNLSLVYYYLKDDWNASLLLNELLRLEPRNTDALNLLADMAWRKENLEEAQSYWEKSYAIKRDPEIKERLARLRKEKNASDSYEDSNTRHFLMKYDGGVADPLLVSEITDYLEEIFQQLSSRFEEYPNAPFVVVLYPQKDYFNITEAPGWSGGVNDGKIKLPIRGVRELNAELRSVLVHELTHSFINSKTSGNCPTWLHEGLAQHMEQKTLSDSAREGLRKLAEQNGLPTMKQLSGSFMSASPDEALVLYVLSYSLTEFLIDHYHFYQLNSLLDKLGEGDSFAVAFQNTYQIPASEIEEEWRRSLLE